MKSFSALLSNLILTSSRTRKVNLLCQYFSETPDPDRGYALAAITGELKFKFLKASFFKELIKSKIDPVLFDLSYDYVGDLAETIALLWQDKKNYNAPNISRLYRQLVASDKNHLNSLISNVLDLSTKDQRWALIKLFTGGLRIGVSNRLAKQALAKLGDIELEEIEKIWHGLKAPYLDLFKWIEKKGDKPDIPYYDLFHPMMLAHPLNEEKDLPLLNPSDYLAEYKWDGIRVQLLVAKDNRRLFSRTGDDISHTFPDIINDLEGNFVLDGELLAGKNNIPSSFSALQKRLNRKNPSKILIKDNPVFIKAYDILFFEGKDVRDNPLSSRKIILENLLRKEKFPFYLSETIQFQKWETLKTLKDQSLELLNEGIMLKKLTSTYVSGRPKGLWFKWKRDPMLVDAVIMYAQRGHGKRSSFYSDFTFGVYNNNKELVPIGKAYSGFDDIELKKLDKFVRKKTINKFGPVREVEKTLVVEVAFDSIMMSKRHKSGIAMRFPRFKRIRWDKPIQEVESLEKIKKDFLTEN